MLLSKLVKTIQDVSGESNPEVLIIGEAWPGFYEIDVHHRRDYYDEHLASKTEFKKGNFVVLERVEDVY